MVAMSRELWQVLSSGVFSHQRPSTSPQTDFCSSIHNTVQWPCLFSELSCVTETWTSALPHLYTKPPHLSKIHFWHSLLERKVWKYHSLLLQRITLIPPIAIVFMGFFNPLRYALLACLKAFSTSPQFCTLCTFHYFLDWTWKRPHKQSY